MPIMLDDLNYPTIPNRPNKTKEHSNTTGSDADAIPKFNSNNTEYEQINPVNNSDNIEPIIPRRPHKNEVESDLPIATGIDSYNSDFSDTEKRAVEPGTPPIPSRPQKESKISYTEQSSSSLTDFLTESTRDASFDSHLSPEVHSTTLLNVHTNKANDITSGSVPMNSDIIVENSQMATEFIKNLSSIPVIPSRPTRKGNKNSTDISIPRTLSSSGSPEDEICDSEIYVENSVPTRPSVPERITKKTNVEELPIKQSISVPKADVKNAIPDSFHEKNGESRLNSDLGVSVYNEETFGDGEKTPGNSNSKITFKHDDESLSAVVSDVSSFNDDVETFLQEKEDNEANVKQAEHAEPIEQAEQIEQEGVERYSDEGHRQERELDGEESHHDSLESTEQLYITRETSNPASNEVSDGQTETSHDDMDDDTAMDDLNFSQGENEGDRTNNTGIYTIGEAIKGEGIPLSGVSEKNFFDVYSALSKGDSDIPQVTKSKEINNPTEPENVEDVSKGDSVELSVAKVTGVQENAQPLVPSRPNKKVIQGSLTTGKVPPPRPKKLSSKISAFQQLFNQEPLAPPQRPMKRQVESENKGSKKLSNDKLMFAESLQGVMGRGVPMPGMVNPNLLRKEVEGSIDKEISDTTQDEDFDTPRPERNVGKSEARRTKGPKGRRLPKSLKDPIKIESRPRFQLVLYKLWKFNFEAPQKEDELEPGSMNEDTEINGKQTIDSVLEEKTAEGDGLVSSEMSNIEATELTTEFDIYKNENDIELNIGVIEPTAEFEDKDRSQKLSHIESQGTELAPKLGEENQIELEADSTSVNEEIISSTPVSVQEDDIVREIVAPGVEYVQNSKDLESVAVVDNEVDNTST